MRPYDEEDDQEWLPQDAVAPESALEVTPATELAPGPGDGRARDFVPPEVRVDFGKDMRSAINADAAAQDWADAREYMRAAFTGDRPALRDVAPTNVASLKATTSAREFADKSNPASPRNVAFRGLMSQLLGRPVPEGLTEASLSGPLSGALGAFVGRRGDKPEDPEMREATLERLRAEAAAARALAEQRGRVKEPGDVEELPDAARDFLERKWGLPAGTLKGVKPGREGTFKPTPKPAPKPKAETGARSVAGLPDGWASDTATTMQRQKFAGVVVASNKAKAITKRLRGLVAEAGASRVLPGALSTRIKSEAEKLRVEVKNVAELGALSGPDMSIIDAIVANPASLSSLAKSVPAQLDAVDAWGDDSIGATADGFNIKHKAGSGKLRVKKGAEVLEIDASDLKDAEADGYEVVP